jgi:predicted esterase
MSKMDLHRFPRGGRAGSKIIAVVIIAIIAQAARTSAFDQSQAIKLSRQYLAAEGKVERAKLTAKLADYRGEIQPVIDALNRHEFEPVQSGYIPARHFSVAELLKKHPDDLLYFNVPPKYRPEQPTGLIVFLHGGGMTTSREAPRASLNFPTPGDDSNQIGDIFATSGMIAVGPSAPWNERSAVRWCMEDVDEYLTDVINECKDRFNIDADRVFLLGHSMGGFGAYHIAQRQPDRFAAVIVNAGSWSRAYLPMLRGTPLCIIQGVHDARAGERWHYTDVAYARYTDELLTKRQLEHTYYEHDGKHSLRFGREYIAKYFLLTQKDRRDPYFPHIALASPVGYRRDCCSPVKHNRWLSLDEAGEGEIEFDELYTNGSEDFDKWRLAHRSIKRPGASIESINRGGNSIDVTTQNVKRFTVWLHPKMIDLTQPVTVVVNGKPRFAEKVTPSLATALESYARRADWGLIYPIKIEFINKH